MLHTGFLLIQTATIMLTTMLSSATSAAPRGDSLLVSDGGRGSDIFWVCKILSSIPLGILFGQYIFGVADENI